MAQVSEVERERLTEHLRVISKKLRQADEAMRESELALREERRRTAHLVTSFYQSSSLGWNLTKRLATDDRREIRNFKSKKKEILIILLLIAAQLFQFYYHYSPFVANFFP